MHIVWYFFLFEMLPFAGEFLLIILWKCKLLLTKRKWKDARKRLFTQRPFVSVIIPGRNEGENFYKLVASLREQTYRNFEIIVVNDGSDDYSAYIGRDLERAGLIDLFISNDTRGGKASAANLALRFAKGEYIVHLDADCSFDRDAIENSVLPFLYDPKIGAVGGNILVRNYRDSVLTILQGIEYIHAFSISRIISSELNIYMIVSGAFGAFRKDVLQCFKGWDVGPGLDGDITIKIRKLGYRIHFEPAAVCETQVPSKVRGLIRQRLRWDKSLIRFRLRKHRDILFPNKAFRFTNFFAVSNDIVFGFIMNFKWMFYVLDMIISFPGNYLYIFMLQFILYTGLHYIKYLCFYLFRSRKNESFVLNMLFMPIVLFYLGYFLRIIRMVAHLKELFFKSSYKDNWNPAKTSRQAKLLKI
jgi:cellulose synthase/poly-beta-1,6-N-acetylglucosamine synthase-like glycosyltransferase